MNKKRIRQMDLALRRRLSDRPAADYFAPGDALLRTIETEGYMQRFTGLFNGTRLRCADAAAPPSGIEALFCPVKPRPYYRDNLAGGFFRQPAHGKIIKRKRRDCR